MRQRDHPWELGEWLLSILIVAFYGLVLVIVLPVYAGLIIALVDYTISGLTSLLTAIRL
jgi:hypothetical protein